MSGTWKSKSVRLERLGPVGNLLCWVETAHVLSRYYNRHDKEKFCRFAGLLMKRFWCWVLCKDGPAGSKCDWAGDLDVAIRKKGIGIRSESPLWDEIFASLKEDIPRLVPLVAGHPSALMRHALLINGYLDENGVQGVEAQDPLRGDYRKLYMRRYFESEVSENWFHPLQTDPPLGSHPSDVVFDETPWNAEILEQKEMSNIQMPPAPAACVSALKTHLPIGAGTLESSGQLLAFPLHCGFFQDLPLGASKEPARGIRFLLEGSVSGRAKVADMFEDPDTHIWYLGRMTVGDVLDSRVTALRSALANDKFVGYQLWFQDWVDLGLETVIVQPSGALDVANVDAKVALFGPRSYLGLESPGLVQKDSREYFSELKTFLRERAGS